MNDVRSLADILRSIRKHRAKYHNLELYARLFAAFPMPVREFITSGSDSVVLRLADGNVLKITQQENIPPQRTWDMPIMDKGAVQADGYSLSWFVQPEGKTPIKHEDLMPFLKQLRADGYRLTDPSLYNLAYYNGEIRLLDPFAVFKIPEGM